MIWSRAVRRPNQITMSPWLPRRFRVRRARRAGESRLPVYALYTPSHEVLVRDFFLPSLADDVELVLSSYQVEGPGDFLDHGFLQTIQQKLDLIIESVNRHDGQVIVWADVDIQFFDSFVAPVRELTSHYDLCFQAENSFNSEVNAGFAAMRCSADTRAFFERVKTLALESGRNEQPVVNDLLAANETNGIVVGRFPPTFYAPTQGPLPEELVLHHANGTVPTEDKTSLELKLEQLRWVRSERGQPLKPHRGSIGVEASKSS